MKVEDFLEHHGIKGMKWGQRRAAKRISTEAKRRDSVREKQKTHGRQSLTNKELGDFNKRMDLENKYVKNNPSKRAQGEAHIAALFSTVGLGVSAYTLYNSAAGKAAIAAGKKALAKEA